MPTSEELQAQLHQANANVELLANEPSNQAEQFAAWRGAMSSIVSTCADATLSPMARVVAVEGAARAMCGA